MSRRRWTYTMGGVPLPEPVEVSEDFQSTSERQPVFTDRYMEGLRATDGTDISTRAKRRAYMEANGLADCSDFKQHWKKAEEERRQPPKLPGLNEAISRAYDTLTRGKR